MVAQLEDGNLMLNMRDNRNGEFFRNGRRICTTTDLGVTWTNTPPPGSSYKGFYLYAELIHTSWEIALLFSNPANQSVRTSMTLKVSTDNGNTWPESYQTELDQYRSAGYSCITSINEDTIGILLKAVRLNSFSNKFH